MAVVLVIVDGPVRRRDRSNNAPPEKLLEERVDVGESIAVGESGKPVLANDAIEFVLNGIYNVVTPSAEDCNSCSSSAWVLRADGVRYRPHAERHSPSGNGTEREIAGRSCEYFCVPRNSHGWGGSSHKALLLVDLRRYVAESGW